MDLYYPLLNKSFEATSGFGQRGTGKHSGVDLKADSGTRVVSIADGEVFKSDDTSDPNGYGGQILIKHLLNGKPYYSKYAHLRKRYVRVGETVTAGEKIGESGGGPNDPNKGRSTGPHLHFEILDGAKQPINPEPILTGVAVLGGAALIGSSLFGKNKDKNKKNKENDYDDGDDDG
jgi:murein DD-endopeptidase MepM/ murein hydrolase activator NlpD